MDNPRWPLEPTDWWSPQQRIFSTSDSAGQGYVEIPVTRDVCREPNAP